MIKQNFKLTDAKIKQNFLDVMKNEDYVPELKFSWSNWGFGMENLENAFKRIKQASINYIELNGNHYTNDLGYLAKEVKRLKKKLKKSILLASQDGLECSLKIMTCLVIARCLDSALLTISKES